MARVSSNEYAIMNRVLFGDPLSDYKDTILRTSPLLIETSSSRTHVYSPPGKLALQSLHAVGLQDLLSLCEDLLRGRPSFVDPPGVRIEEVCGRLLYIQSDHVVLARDDEEHAEDGVDEGQLAGVGKVRVWPDVNHAPYRVLAAA